MTYFRWFPELSTSYSRLNYGNHVPLPHFKDNRPIKNSHLITIKSSQPGSNFAERYYQTLDRAIKPLLSQVPLVFNKLFKQTNHNPSWTIWASIYRLQVIACVCMVQYGIGWSWDSWVALVLLKCSWVTGIALFLG